MGVMRVRRLAVVVTGLLVVLEMTNARVRGQLQEQFFDGADRPEIGYYTRRVADPVSVLNQKIQDGKLSLTFEPGHGYLRSILTALHVPVESQIAAFSKTSVQSDLISPQSPRTIFFNDSVAVGWPRGGFIEIAAQDPVQGVIFYALPQQKIDKPQFTRTDRCLSCHNSYATLNVPGMLVRSIVTAADGRTVPRLGNYTSDDRSPFAERWGGWYVTGEAGSMRHLGNSTVTDVNMPELVASHPTPGLASLGRQFDTAGYLSPYSDIVALMVFEHQMYMTNLLTRFGWEVRLATAEKRADAAGLVRRDASELVDYMRGHGAQRVLFGSNYPMLTPRQAMNGLDTWNLDPNVRAAFLHDNAVRVFKL